MRPQRFQRRESRANTAGWLVTWWSSVYPVTSRPAPSRAATTSWTAIPAVVVSGTARTRNWVAGAGVWTLVVVLFLGGVQLISVGILGRYLARVHEQTLRRPLYLVDRVVTSDQPSGTGGASSR